MHLKSAVALQRLGLRTDATQQAVLERATFCLASLAEDYRKAETDRTISTEESLRLVTEFEGYRELFGCVSIRRWSERSVATGRSERSLEDDQSTSKALPCWAGCFCKDDLVFVRYFK